MYQGDFNPLFTFIPHIIPFLVSLSYYKIIIITFTIIIINMIMDNDFFNDDVVL